MPVRNYAKETGFTIVELLIVIIVIGILAALVLVAYGSVTDQAKVSAAKNDLEQIAKQLNTYKEQTGGGSTYPADTSSLTYSNGTSLQYSVNNSLSPATYCVTATNGNKSYFISSTAQSPASGGCPGHGVNGVAAITNLVRNPTGTGSSANYYNSGWFYALGTNIDTPNVTFGGRSDWHKISSNGSTNTSRARINLSDLTNGQTYTYSLLVANPGASAANIEYDFCDQGNLNTSVPAGATQRLYVTGTRSTYDSTYSFIDIDVGTNTTGLLVTQAMLTAGSTQYNYADGGSTNWVWNGTANAATSTGPAV